MAWTGTATPLLPAISGKSSFGKASTSPSAAGYGRQHRKGDGLAPRGGIATEKRERPLDPSLARRKEGKAFRIGFYRFKGLSVENRDLAPNKQHYLLRMMLIIR